MYSSVEGKEERKEEDRTENGQEIKGRILHGEEELESQKEEESGDAEEIKEEKEEIQEDTEGAKTRHHPLPYIYKLKEVIFKEVTVDGVVLKMKFCGMQIIILVFAFSFLSFFLCSPLSSFLT